MADDHVSTHVEPWSNLEGKVVMVTGASSGIGREFCLDLAKAGCRIIAAARRTDRLKSLCDEINHLTSCSSSSMANLESSYSDSGVKAVAVKLDVSAEGRMIEALVRQSWEVFGRIDVLINNAGVRGDVKSTLDISEEQWNSTIQTNLTGAWLVAKYVCILLRDAKLGGCIINISSLDGLHRGHLPGSVAYSASKAALDTLTKVMALELGAFKIRVNSISPGLFRSEITEGLMQNKRLNNVVRRIIPMKTLGSVDPALTSLVRYLIHDSSQYVTGNIYIVDAGTSLPGVPIFSSL